MDGYLLLLACLCVLSIFYPIWIITSIHASIEQYKRNHPEWPDMQEKRPRPK